MREVHGWRRVARWLVGILGGLLALVVVLAIVTTIVVQTGWGRGMLRDQIAARLNDTFVGGASLGRVEGNPLTELVLHDLVINGPDKQPAVTIERLTVKVPLLPLISHQIRVEKVIADGLDVRAKQLPDGTFNLANLTSPSEPSTWSIDLPSVEVRRGHVAVDRIGGSEPIDIDDLEIYIDARLPFGGPVEASARVTGTWRQKQAPISIGGILRDSDAKLEVRNAGVRIGEVRAVALGVSIPKGPFSKAYEGTVALNAPARALRELVPSVRVPADLALAATARPDGRLTHFTVGGTVGDGEVSAFGRADVQAKLASLVVAAANLDLAKLTRGSMGGTGGAVATLEVDGSGDGELPAASGVITAWSDLPDMQPMTAAIAIDSDGELVRTTIGVRSDGGIRAGIGAVVRKRGDEITLERADLVARTLDVRRATSGRAPLSGVFRARLHAEGRLAPEPNLAIAGHANGRRLRIDGARADRLALRVDARGIPSHPIGSGRVELFEVERGDLQFSKLTVAAGNRPDGKIQVSVRSQPKPAPWRVDVDALVTTGETVVVQLQRHFVRAAGGAIWRGNTGVLTVAPRRIDLRGLRSTSSDGHITADGSYVRAGRNQGDLTARLDASIELGNIRKGHAGHVDAELDVRRKRDSLTGTLVASAKGVTFDPKSPIAFDGDAKIVARAEQLLANIDITTANAGSAKLALDVDAPKDVSDMRAWRRLGRDSIRTLELTLSGVKLDQIAKLANTEGMVGRIDGTVELSPVKAGGVIKIRDVQVPQTKDIGRVNADLRVAQAGQGAMTTTLTARLVPNPGATAVKEVTQGGDARLFVEAGFATPDRIFDPAAWRRLGPGAFRGGMVRAERFAFQPGTLERFGIMSALRGEVSVAAEVEQAMKEVRFAVNLYDLRGGLRAEPVTVTLLGAVDDTATRANAFVRNSGITILQLSGEVPVTLDELRDDPQRARSAPLTARARIQQVPARTLMTVIGTSQITGGTLDGTVDVGGTVDTPTLAAKLVARGVTVPSTGTQTTQQIGLLTLAATWDGTSANVTIDADQSKGGRLEIRAAGSPSDLDNVTASIFAKNVDIAPLVAFMPGPAGGLAGQLEADFKLRGANPTTAQLAGSLHITDGRIPIAPAVGTLFKGDMRVDVRDQVFGLRLKGKLGRGDVSLFASAPLQGVTPKSGNARLVMRDVQLIGKTEPIITGVIHADIARVGDTWRSNLRVTRMNVKVPEEKGTELKPVGAPPDLVYGGVKIHHGENKGTDTPGTLVRDDGPVDFQEPSRVEAPGARRKLPTDPALVAEVRLRNVFVESEEVRGIVSGELTVAVAEDREVSIVGDMSLSRAVLELFSRRYEVDRAALHFDGSMDPVLDIRITHSFPEVTTITEVRGRLSDPELVLASDPALYSQAELLGFLLGGEPSGAPQMGPSPAERVAGTGASIIGNVIGGYVKRALPVDLDVLRYEAETSTSSAAITVGTWITDSLFLAYRQRLESRPDENSGEGEFEYWIRRRLVLEGVVGDRGVNGLDLLWRRRW